MRTRTTLVLAGGFTAFLAWGVIVARDQAPPATAQKSKTALGTGRADDEAAIRKASQDFAQAFAEGDAKKVASFWTEDGEHHDDGGEMIRGRPAIEKAFAELFKDRPKSKIEVHINAVRFLGRDSAIEEGILRQTRGGKELPSTTLYSVVHVREDGQWKMTIAREWGAGQHRIEDLDWLIGTWKAILKNEEVTLSFAKDPKKPFINGEFVKKAKGKVVTAGTMRIGIDPQGGQLRSWHFEDDGGHAQSLWVRDGNNWMLDCIGVGGDGTPHEAVNVLGKLNNNEITWRSIDRIVGEQPMPDTAPVKLVRVQQGRQTP